MKDRLRTDIDKVMKEMEDVKKIGKVKTKDSTLPAIMGIAMTKIITPKGVDVFEREAKRPTGKTTGGAYRCQMDGCPGYRIAVKWKEEDYTRYTHPCSKGMLLSKKGWRIL
jgi:hypothetical protein